MRDDLSTHSLVFGHPTTQVFLAGRARCPISTALSPTRPTIVFSRFPRGQSTIAVLLCDVHHGQPEKRGVIGRNLLVVSVMITFHGFVDWSCCSMLRLVALWLSPTVLAAPLFVVHVSPPVVIVAEIAR